MHKTTLHGGFEDQDIIDWMSPILEQAFQDSSQEHIVFFDEANACSAMGLVKEIICDGYLNHQIIPKNVHLIAAINPYRLRTDNPDEMPGLSFKHAGAMANLIPDPLENLVYRVFPMADSFVDHMFDYGSLSEQSERLYVDAIIKKYISHPTNQDEKEFLELFKQLLCMSQSFIRENLRESSAVSLRDIERSVRLLKWFNTKLFESEDRFIIGKQLNVDSSTIPAIRECLALTLGHCYHSRLDRYSREKYLRKIYQCWRQSRNLLDLNLTSKRIREIITSVQKMFTQRMNPDNGIAHNEALCENIFMLVVCISNNIPIFVIGEPGSSKSLAMELIATNMKGKQSGDSFLQCFPSIEVFTYQCSPLSTASGIAATFSAARKYAQESPNDSNVCVLLDEISLAEQSPHLPLKVLHRELEQKNVSVVAISNYKLDPAKLNRAIHLSRSNPTLDDLESTARGIVTDIQMEQYLKSLAKAYDYVHSISDSFFGLRDYYQLVKYLSRNHDHSRTATHLLYGVLRNFNYTIQNKNQLVVNTFSSETRKDLRELRFPSSLELIQENLHDRHARHLMVMAKDQNMALQTLFDKKVLQVDETDVLFGSDFPADTSDLYLSMSLKRIRLCMAEGRTVVLIHCEALYESLYDLLNQHYVRVKDASFARLAFGSSSVLCQVHQDFRIIVIVQEQEARNRLARPFLNRFEKLCIRTEELLISREENIKRQLETQVTEIMKKTQSSSLNELFVGVHPDIQQTLCSLILSVNNCQDPLQAAMNRLLWIATPEAILRMSNNDVQDRYFDKYFSQQHHENLPQFFDYALKLNRKQNTWGDEKGLLTVVSSFSSLDSSIEKILETQLEKEDISMHYLQLHEMTSQNDLNLAISKFYESSKESLLVIHCDLLATSQRRLQYAKYNCMKDRSKCYERHHIIIIVNLVRNMSYSFDFEKTFNYIFLDELISSDFSYSRGDELANFPSLASALRLKLTEILERVGLDTMLKNNLHAALSKIVYPVRRTPHDVKNQYQFVSNLLDQDHDFNSALKEKVLSLLSSSLLDINNDNWLLDVAVDSRHLAISGTFRSALYHHVARNASRALAAILSFIDKNNNLTALRQEDQSYRTLWLEFFKELPTKAFELRCSQLNQSSTVDVSPGDNPLIKTRLPFSAEICQAIKAAREPVEQRGDIVVALESHINLFFPYLNQINELHLINNYIHDYLIQHGVPELANQLDFENAVLPLLKPFLNSFQNNSIAKAQAFLWRNEKVIHAVLTVMTKIGIERSQQLVRNIIEKDQISIPTVIIETVDYIFTYVNPKNFTQDSINWPQNLLDAVNSVSFIASNMLSLASEIKSIDSYPIIDLDNMNQKDQQQNNIEEPLDNNNNSNNGERNGKISSSSSSQTNQERRSRRSSSSRHKKSRRPYVIIIPAAPSSLITMYNVKDFLERGVYVTPEEAKKTQSKKPTEVMVTRKSGDGARTFKIVDNPTKLSKEDWRKVVAAFATGQLWQFKGWFSENPAEIFSKVKGFHVHRLDRHPNETVKQWPIHMLRVSEEKDYINRQTVHELWTKLDEFINYRRRR
eukprot:gb/GECH01011079.1/.p1 GENE.gb/GECH01011079.1/~~gb/GECH01011079.1/.p1  ORF type:complete len:1561 (+),score=386.09 gb/GECH01011079.1/:1-4683(+)